MKTDDRSAANRPHQWCKTAPANIALIKYMGKTGVPGNLPVNTSISYTLSNLKSVVELEQTNAAADSWQPLLTHEGRKLMPLDLSAKGRDRFLAHFDRIKKRFGCTESFIVRSGNDFPSDCGLASSASSFAALTSVAIRCLEDVTQKSIFSSPDKALVESAVLSRQGSGSSCRSFFSPWSIWNSEGVSGIDLLPEQLIHQVIVVDDGKKTVSSSEAHTNVTSSALFAGRPERAEERARRLCAALRSGDWRAAFETTWAEFWDMHALFETSLPSFGYMNEGSLAVLRKVRKATWEAQDTGPLITMDAGPTVHLLHRADSTGTLMARDVCEMFRDRYRVFTDGQQT